MYEALKINNSLSFPFKYNGKDFELKHTLVCRNLLSLLENINSYKVNENVPDLVNINPNNQFTYTFAKDMICFTLFILLDDYYIIYNPLNWTYYLCDQLDSVIHLLNDLIDKKL